MRAGRKPSAKWDASAIVLQANPGQWMPLAPNTQRCNAIEALAARGRFEVETRRDGVYARAVEQVSA